MKRYLFGKYVLDVPDDHSIYDIHRKDVLYDRLYGTVVERICEASPSGVVIDIGANIGDTAALIATYARNPIVSIEGSDKYIEYLRRNAPIIGQQVSVLERFVIPACLKGHQLRYVLRDGSGFLASVDSELVSIVPRDKFIDVPSMISACRSKGEGVALVKSDTDGCDGFIVAELMDELAVPLFFECDLNETNAGHSSPWPDVFRRLEESRYGIIVFDNAGIPMCIAEDGVGELLRDLSGYIHMQRCAGLVKIYYLDVWAFPPNTVDLFRQIGTQLRKRFLHPYGF